MGSRKKRGEPPKQPWIAAGLSLLVAAGFAAAILWRYAQPDRAAVVSPPSTASGPAARAAPADWSLPGDLPALPVPKSWLRRPADAVRASYEFAARHPEVVQQLPCFCGCHKLGHRSNHDCFVAARDTGGRVTWDAHGMG